MNRFKLELLRYWLAMNGSAVQAAAHSVKAFMAVAGAHAAVDSVPALNLHQTLAVFLFSFGLAALDFLDKNPLPALPSLAPDPRLVASAPTAPQPSTPARDLSELNQKPIS